MTVTSPAPPQSRIRRCPRAIARLVGMACLAAVLAVPTAAHAHTLTIGLAAAKARTYAATLGAQTWPSQEVDSRVTGCGRVNRQTVNCAFYMVAEGETVAHSIYRCDGAVQVYYLGQRSRYRYTRGLGIVRCAAVESGA